MSVNFSPNVISSCPNCNPKPVEKSACDTVLPAICREPEIIAKADFKDSELRISTAMKGMLDTNKWYTIKADGSGLIQTAWCPGADVKAGVYSDIYKEAQERKEANGGTLTDEDAVELLEKIEETDIITRNGA